MKDWIELPHQASDGYKVSAEYTYLVVNSRLERVPVRFQIQLEWEDDEDDGYYQARLITSEGNVIDLEPDYDEGVDSTGGVYYARHFYLPELRGQDTAKDFYCGYFDLFLELSVREHSGTVGLFPLLHQDIKHNPVI